MPDPTLNDIVQKPLTDLSTATIQEERKFAALRVFPMVPVEEKAGLFYQYNVGDFLRDEMQPRADGARAAESGYGLATGTYTCLVEALGKVIGPQMRANSRAPLQPDMDATRFLSQKAMIRAERRWMTAFFGTGVWTNERAGVLGVPAGTDFLRWGDAASTPIEDLGAMQDTVESSTGLEPNVLVIGKRVFRALKQHPDVRDYFKYTRPGVITAELLAGVFGVDEVIVCAGAFNTAAKGAPAAIQYIAGNHALLAYRARNPGPMEPSAGYHFAWTGYLGAGAAGTRVTKERIPNTGGADEIVIEAAWQPNLVSAALGGFFFNAA